MEISEDGKTSRHVKDARIQVQMNESRAHFELGETGWAYCLCMLHSISLLRKKKKWLHSGGDIHVHVQIPDAEGTTTDSNEKSISPSPKGNLAASN